MANWRFAVGDHSLTAPEWQLDVQSPSVTWYLSGQPHEFTGTVQGQSEGGTKLEELVQDVWAYRNNELMFRGPLIGCQDTLDGDQHQVALTAHSYRERLAHWPIPYPTSGTATTVPLGTATPVGLGWLAINLTNPHSDLANILVDKHTASGASVSQSAQSGTATDAAIDAVTLTSAYDWDLIPNQTTGQVEYHTWAPTRGATHPEYALIVDAPGISGANCTLVRTFDLSAFGNEVWMNGQDTSGNPLYATAPTTRTYGPEGLWIVTASPTTNTTGATTNANLQAQAATQLGKSSVPAAAYTLTPVEGWWPGPDTLWLGDAPTLIVKSGRLNVNAAARIQQIQAQPADGAENITLTLAAKPIGKAGEFALSRALKNLANRIKAVEWRQ